MNLPLAASLILLVGATGGKLARLINLPSVTGYLFAGILLGPSVANIISKDMLILLNPVSELAFGVIALSIGAELRRKNLRGLVKDAAKVFVAEAGLTFVLVLITLSLFGLPIHLALLFSVLAIATAPGAVIACIRENPINSNFPKALLTVVALDNLFAIILFGVIVSYLQASLAALDSSGITVFLLVFRNLGLAVFIGVCTGAFLTGVARWSKNDSITLVLVLGAVLGAVGLASLLDVPSLLAAMSAGVFYVNLSPTPQRVSRSLQSVEGPIILMFLTLAGTKLNLAAVPAIGVLGLLYILARLVGKVVGSRVGASFTRFPGCWKQHLGRALTPQAGVAIGLAIIAEEKLPYASGLVTTVILGAVVVFEIIGPILIKRALCEIDCLEPK